MIDGFLFNDRVFGIVLKSERDTLTCGGEEAPGGEKFHSRCACTGADGMMVKSRRWVACALCVLVLCAAALICVCVMLSALLRSRCGAREEDGEFQRAAVAADSLACSRIGRDVLKDGGSAVDAAIAALLCTSLFNPQSMGLGGGAIFTIMDKNGAVKVINSRETVPQSFSPDLLTKCPKYFTFATGAQWIGVPGELMGYARAHALYGKLEWAELFKPTIRLAREGFDTPKYLSRLLQNPQIKALLQNTSFCELFYHKDKEVLKPKDKLWYPKLAETLQIIADQGVDAFYTGKIAQDLINDVQKAGGTLSLEDLRTFQVRVSEAKSVPVGEYTMHFPPPPAGGALLSFILNVMHGFGLSPSSVRGEEHKKTLYRYIETLKYANGQRRYSRDPQFHPHLADHLLDPGFADRIRMMIISNSKLYNVTPMTDQLGTTHVSVLASDGSAVSVTSTINHIFGSVVYSPNTGIILNNELADFCGRADSISTGEQPPSSMSPVIIHSKNKEKVLIIGGSGGTLITTAMAMSIMNNLWFGKNLKDSIRDRVVQVGPQNSVAFEPHFNEVMKEAMRSLGQTVFNQPYFLNAVNAVTSERGCISAYSDERKLSEAAGD
ncbi:glutathione hydrolase 5 proenzyme [Trichomycterus rosablanca]|uniref:glutathione hydrolase 5 proenzyme n=1 Tax=Trichomycterus rosablanca TaxID=2290929 RepID=UPI002F352BDC